MSHLNTLRTNLNRSLLSISLRSALSLAAIATPVMAVHAAERSYAIAAGPLGTALSLFASASDVMLSFSSESTAGLRTNGLNGAYSLNEGFARLLAGSGLQVRQESEGRYTLVKSNNGAAVELGATNVNGLALGETTEGTGSYTTGSISIGKTAQSIKETPQTVSVISRQRIEDQNLTNIGKALDQTTGITESSGGTANSEYYSRGFKLSNYRVDGGASVAKSVWKTSDTSIYDHIEVLRGADGLFSGVGEPGGSVNLVRKRPTAENQVVIRQSAGRWDDYRTELDVGGPLAFDGKLRGRAVFVNQDRDSFIDDAGQSRNLFYGVLEADLTDTTNVLVGYWHDRIKSADQVYGLPRYSTGEDLKLSRSFNLAGKHDYLTNEFNTGFLRVDQMVGERWELSLDATYMKLNQDRGYYNFSGAVDPADGSGVAGAWLHQDLGETEKSVDVSLKGNFELFGLQHKLVAGWMLDDDKFYNPVSRAGSEVVSNIFGFDSSIYPSQKRLMMPSYFEKTNKRVDGVYSSVRMQLAEPLHWVVGGSLSNYKYYDFFQFGQFSPSITKYEDDNVWVPFTGLTYDLTSEWTAYSSIAEIYTSQARYLKAPGSPLDPVTGTTYEVGVKGELLQGKVNTYFSIYYTKRDGEAASNPDVVSSTSDLDGSRCCYVAKGQSISKGVDFEVTGELADRLQASFGYTYNQNEDRQADAALSSITPKHLVKVFAAYQLPGNLSQWKVGGGVRAQSSSYSSGTVRLKDSSGRLTDEEADFDFSQPGYALWSAFAKYEINKNWDVSANFENIFDKRYYAGIGYSNYGNWYGEPRSYSFTLQGKF